LHIQTPHHTQRLSSILIDTKGANHEYKLKEIGLPIKRGLKTKPLPSNVPEKNVMPKVLSNPFAQLFHHKREGQDTIKGIIGINVR
jgi:hypothetical protein